MELIILTTKIDGKKMYANPQQICAVYPKYDDDDTTIIQFTSNSFSEVLESADAVADMIANCGERRE